MKHGREKLLLIVCLAFIVSASPDAASPSEEIRIGSKKFTESVIVADLAAKLATSIGARVVHRQELGGTRLLWDALLARQIDVYPYAPLCRRAASERRAGRGAAPAGIGGACHRTCLMLSLRKSEQLSASGTPPKKAKAETWPSRKASVVSAA